MRRIEFGTVVLTLGWVTLGTSIESAPIAQAADGPQVTMFTIVATPQSSKLDPKLAHIEGQLHKVLPDHSFKLLDVQRRRVRPGDVVVSKLEGGRVASARLVDPPDAEGKVKLRCELTRGRDRELDTLVTTPLNQLFFCNKRLPDGTQLLIGVGAR